MDEIELNGNWYLTVGGIGFSYEPYEVASFAVGFVSYVLPWEVLKPWLREGASRGAAKVEVAVATGRRVPNLRPSTPVGGLF